jgi:hypothetical protein
MLRVDFRHDQWEQTSPLIPDFPKATAFAIPATERFFQIDSDHIYDGETELSKLTAKIQATASPLQLERLLGQRE